MRTFFKGTIVFIAVLSLTLCSCSYLKNHLIPKKETIPPLNDSYFGINGGKAIHIPNELDTTVTQRIKWMQELGVKWDRTDWWWHVAEPEKGKFDFTLLDKIAKLYKENGIQLYPILCYGAPWWEKGRNAPANDEEIDEYIEYVKAVVARYKNDFRYWSVWNEPNIPNFWQPTPNPEMYAKMLKKTYTAIKSIDKNLKVCAPALAPIGPFDRSYFEKLCQLGCLEYIDIFDYHYYRETPPEMIVLDEISELKAIMLKYGVQMPIWISETGQTTDIINKDQSYQNQASLIVRNHLICLGSGVSKIFYFDLQNWNDAPKESWDSKLGLIQADGEKKNSFFAYKNLIAQIDHKKIIGVKNLQKNIKAVLYYDNKNNIYSMALWTDKTNSEKPVKIYISGKPSVLDIYGAEITPKTKVSKSKKEFIELYLSENPVYINNVSKEKYLPFFGVQLVNPMIELVAGASAPLNISIDSLLKKPKSKVYIPDLPKGISFDSKTDTISVNEECIPGNKSLKVQVYLGKLTAKEKPHILNLNLRVIQAYRLGLRPYVTDENRIKVKVSVLNNSKKTVEGPVSIFEVVNGKTSKIAETDSISVDPQKEAVTEISVPADTFKNYSGELYWYSEFNNNQSEPFRIYTVAKIDKPLEIDGNLSDWKNIPAFLVNKAQMVSFGEASWEENKVSAVVKLALSDNAVFIGAKVYDKSPGYNPKKDNMLYQADSLELYMGFCGPNTKTVIDKKTEFQIGLAPNNSGTNKPVVFLYHYDYPIKDAQIASKVNKNSYTIEAEVPFKDLFNVSIEGKEFIGLDLKLDDLNKDEWAPAGVRPGRSLIWGGGHNTMNWINPSGWSMGIIKPANNE